MDAPLRLERGAGPRLAYRKRAGSGPLVLWLGGFASDMEGSKALALDADARAAGRAFVRFDYSGHGASDGVFRQGRIGQWRDDALDVLDRLCEGPTVVVGSSMGAWLACLVALARPERVRGLVLLAPAVDFTERLLAPALPPEARAAFAEGRPWRRASAYDPAGYEIEAGLIEEGRRWLLLPGPVPIRCPVRILQGGADPDVPWLHALETANALEGDDVVFTLVKDGDHRLSRPADLSRMLAAVTELRGLA